MESTTTDIRVHGQDVRVTQATFGQKVSGWITSTQTSTGEMAYYGLFPTVEEALEWAKVLENATIEPVYCMAYSAG
jgi:hypothetical protein